MAEMLTKGVPGKGVALLIDCLTKHKGETITLKELTELYPWGFYKEEVCEDYIDNYLKPKKVKWAELY